MTTTAKKLDDSYLLYGRLADIAQKEAEKVPREHFPMLLPGFDEAMAGGFREGELITVSGYTGRGKTTFCQYINKNLQAQGVPTFWFSYEMQSNYLYENFRKMGMIDDPDIYVPEKLVAYSVDFIEQMIVKADAEACKVLFIDHLHYLIPLSAESNYVSFTVGDIVRRLKKLAVDYGKIIILVAHTRKDDDDEIKMSDIRDSSLIPQESDYVYLVHRLKNTNPQSEEMMSKQTKIILAKNRRTGKQIHRTFTFDGKDFKPYESDEYTVPARRYY